MLVYNSQFVWCFQRIIRLRLNLVIFVVKRLNRIEDLKILILNFFLNKSKLSACRFKSFIYDHLRIIRLTYSIQIK